MFLNDSDDVRLAGSGVGKEFQLLSFGGDEPSGVNTRFTEDRRDARERHRQRER